MTGELLALRGLDPGHVWERVEQADAEELAGLVRGLVDPARQKCADDGLAFLRMVKTRDEASEDGEPKAFPVEQPAIPVIWSVLAGPNHRITIAKSRQIMASWLACAFCVWWAKFKANRLVLWQTQVWEDALEKVCTGTSAKFLGRCQFIERSLPAWLRDDIRETEGRIEYPNGSQIRALPGGADKVRGLTASLIIEDEFAYQQEAPGVYTAVMPLVQKATKFVAISTPNGRSNTFAELYHGMKAVTG